MRTLLTVLSTAIILFACSNPGDSKGEGKTGDQQTGSDQKANTNITINYVAIEFDECGQGDTTLLFVHGWCINKEYWADQSKYFSDKYKVVALDLPGFGNSGKNRTEWTFE